MDVLRKLEEAGAIYRDHHFVYKKHGHGRHYINPDPIFPDVALIDELGDQLAYQFFPTPYEPGDSYPEVIAGAATGGIPYVYATARSKFLRPGTEAVWADKNGDDFRFERATFADRVRDKRVLVVEDLVNTGDTTFKICREVESHGGILIGVSAVCNRGGATAEQLGVKRFEVLASVDFTSVAADECELCKNGVPIVEDVAHGGRYKLAHPDYDGGYVKLL